MDLRQLESESSLQTWLLWAAEAFPRDPRFLMKLATHIYGLAVHGISERCVELPGERRRVAPLTRTGSTCAVRQRSRRGNFT